MTYPQVVVVRNEDDEHPQVLLIKRADLLVWAIPGGIPEESESMEQAAEREVLEETGYTVNIVRHISTYTLPKIPALGRAFLYRANVISGKRKTSSESVDVRWFSSLKLPYTLLPYHRQRIKDAVNNKNKVLLIKQKWTTITVLLYYLPFPVILIRLIRRAVKK